ncbi:hypothetical protein WA026_018064 [Henosepilachna vigintioctopunctata]|uniref:Uncharacterized protein n=1 Tax=Henosepilachna vigintioctopunctata TaxID=420089 RepID=A0AAW1UQT8_9CUCU
MWEQLQPNLEEYVRARWTHGDERRRMTYKDRENTSKSQSLTMQSINPCHRKTAANLLPRVARLSWDGLALPELVE